METHVLTKLIENNAEWAKDKLQQNNQYFTDLAKGQKPEILWIGCSDSRVSATEILGVELGEMFVHRNIANMAPHTDLNFLSVLEYAVKVLEVKHIIVCGHYECGGVKAAMSNASFGIIDNWIRNIKEVYKSNHSELDAIQNEQERFDRFVELNVMKQVQHISETTICKPVINQEFGLTIHGWVFDMRTGKIKVLI
jgi:carbonic anhydrase